MYVYNSEEKFSGKGREIWSMGIWGNYFYSQVDGRMLLICKTMF